MTHQTTFAHAEFVANRGERGAIGMRKTGKKEVGSGLEIGDGGSRIENRESGKADVDGTGLRFSARLTVTGYFSRTRARARSSRQRAIKAVQPV
jgi:hypothetical protein